MKEQVSALMDNQLDGPGGDGCLKRLTDEAALKESWEVYHLIGDVLRGTAAHSLPGSFRERLAAEPTVLAPRRAVAARPPRNAWYALSAAASVVAVAFVGWMAQQSFQGPAATLAEALPPPIVAEVPAAQGVAGYLLAHQRYSPSSAMAGVAPYVRTVADEIRNR